MNNNKSRRYSRENLEAYASRVGLELSEAGRHVRYEAANNNERLPRWQLSDGRHQNSIRGYATLAEVAEALDRKASTLG